MSIGVVVAHGNEQTKNKMDCYIQYVQTEPSVDGPIEIVVTMLQDLIELVHYARATLHDKTYVCVFGEHNEWEVVIWDECLNKCECLTWPSRASTS